MKWIIATSNQGKLKEFKTALKDIELITLKDVNINTLPEETGETFAANALIKARYVCQHTNLPTLADDSGLCVNALNGAPGIYSARYGNQPNDEARITYLLEKLKNHPNPADRKAQFICSLALVFPDGTETVCYGEVEGTIIKAPKGNQGFGYDPVFYTTQLGKTFGEASKTEKQSISHRTKALNKLIKRIKIELS